MKKLIRVNQNPIGIYLVKAYISSLFFLKLCILHLQESLQKLVCVGNSHIAVPNFFTSCHILVLCVHSLTYTCFISSVISFPRFLPGLKLNPEVSVYYSYIFFQSLFYKHVHLQYAIFLQVLKENIKYYDINILKHAIF